MSIALNQSLNELLEATSRSFYLTLRVLPGTIRAQIGLAYLLARTTDTVADTAIVAVEQRLAALAALRERILGKSREKLALGELAQHQGLPAEEMLLEKCEEALTMLDSLEVGDQQRIREVLEIITSGQELDLKRFAGASEKAIVLLQNDADLDDYTYRVAGCVGEFWTKMCRAHEFPDAKLDDAWLLKSGVRFGKGLQLVNILRDIPVDLRNGRCYVPAEALTAAGLKAEDLLDPRNEARFRPLYDKYLAQAEGHLAAGWEYTNALPRGCMRVRLACAWPILIGAKTIGRLRKENVLDPEQRISITRAEVKQLMMRSVMRYPWAGAWRKMVELRGA